jgi:hypothetical protein
VRRRQARHVGERDGGDHGQAGADPQQAGIHRHVVRAHGEARRIAADDGDERAREQDAQDGAGAAEHEALAEQRPAKRGAAGAQRRPDRELALAPDGARQNQVGDIRARDDEHEGSGGEQPIRMVRAGAAI